MENRELLYIYTFRKECLQGWQVRAMEMLEGRRWFLAVIPPEDHHTIGNEEFRGDDRVESFYHRHGAFHLTIKSWNVPLAERTAHHLLNVLLPVFLLVILFHSISYGTLMISYA